MLKKRIIPVLLLRNGWLVQSYKFKEYKNLGNPTAAVKRLTEWGSDELIYLDISKDGDEYDLRREDLKTPNRTSIIQIMRDVATFTYMPITVGGGIRTMKDVETRLKAGADKVAINTMAIQRPAFITEIAKEFGAQCVVVSVDAKLVGNDHKVVKNGQEVTDLGVEEFVKKVADSGAGEVLINSVDEDGGKMGYDLDLLSKVKSAVSIPVIALGGAGDWDDFAEAFDEAGVDAVAAANIFQHVDQSVYLAKKQLYEKGYPVRAPELLTIDKVNYGDNDS